MLGEDLPTLGGHTQRACADAERASGLGQVQPWLLRSLLGHVALDAMMAAQGGHALLRPAVASSRAHAIAIQKAGDQLIGTEASQHSDSIDGFPRRVGSVLSATSPWQAQL